MIERLEGSACSGILSLSTNTTLQYIVGVLDIRVKACPITRRNPLSLCLCVRASVCVRLSMSFASNCIILRSAVDGTYLGGTPDARLQRRLRFDSV